MRCGFCGREIVEETARKACGACPGGCRKVHCPWCGYENPAPPRFLKRWAEKKEEKRED